MFIKANLKKAIEKRDTIYLMKALQHGVIDINTTFNTCIKSPFGSRGL